MIDLRQERSAGNCRYRGKGNGMNEKNSVKIFYSWQSDLPNSETRGFIQSCIDAAAKALRDMVYIEADRDTKGEYFQPHP